MTIKQAYNLNEISIVPSATTDVVSRSQCSTRYIDGNLPLFIAPMCSVIDDNNFKKIKESGFNCIIPRTVDYVKRINFLKQGEWVAFGLREAEYISSNFENYFDTCTIKICIDQANGHMKKLLDVCKSLSSKRSDRIKIEIMTGNIANPESCKYYEGAGINYIRIGIGSGNVCTTSLQTGIHYPMASLIYDCRKVIDDNNLNIKLVADGGFENISQIIKALALGADYCMIGKIAAGFKESCGARGGVYCEYFGMSTQKAQILINEASLFKESDFHPKHSEGKVDKVNVICTANEWVSSFEHALKSAMSYTNRSDINEFIGSTKYPVKKHEFVIMSPVNKQFNDF